MIIITGDTHGTADRSKLNTKEFPEQKNMSKDDYVIIAGDVAMLWSSFTKLSPNELSSEDKNLIEWYDNKNFTTLFIDGNHDNHKALVYFFCRRVEWGKDSQDF